MNTPAWTPDDPDGNAAELQTMVDNESVVVLPSSYTGGAATAWPCAPITLPDDHAVRLIGGGCRVRPAGLAGTEAWCSGSERATAHIVSGINVEGKGNVGVGFRPGSQWSLLNFTASGLRAGVQIVQDKSMFTNFTISKCTAGFLTGPTTAHGGDQHLVKGRVQSCTYGFEVASESAPGAKDGGRMEIWVVDGTHIDNLDWVFYRASSVQGDPPLLIDCVFEAFGGEFINVGRYHDPGPGGIVGGNVWVGGNCTFDGEPQDNVRDFRADNIFLGDEAERGWNPDSG